MAPLVTSLPDSILQRLNVLRVCLGSLPATVPLSDAVTPRYDFRDWQCNTTLLEDFGTHACVLNHDLEVVLAPNGRRPGTRPVEFKERGPGLTAVPDAIAAALLKTGCASDAVLEKWIDDL
ncbi:uncharacterized protein BXZ73DRAFT_44947, partial [Epithele typhae]|uniref:uncharacterized protein n=1 Tax=Epithele typhae TaxID=378194 RepID=UPI002007EA8C